jgi:SOS-response transcriptional repressor LexA
MKKKPLSDTEKQEAARLKEIFDARKRGLGLTHESIAEQLNVSQGAVSHYLNGNNALNLRAAAVFAKALGISVSEFSPRLQIEMDQVGLASVSHSSVREPGAEYEVNAEPQKTTAVPLISWVQAGAWCESPDNYAPGDAEEWMPAPYKHGPRAFCLRVIGDSMSPEYRETEVILVDPDVEPRHNDDVVARTADGLHTFKRLQITPDGTYLLALNPDQPNRKIQIPVETHICGVVIGSWIRRR